ncbi:DUF5635 domain-containing protein [Corynebacterium felinum]|uniref:ATP-dependent DNA helicase RecG n=1 Tax=Corynebacterium felinum TaxID=131318 RepID=A0ABU2B6E7_9CORY|nr:DUF5635 domain-containing protein [Corynebacterium felinum]MDF5820759.1 DUF5635 domain-containing protein [Corynebacterium felinum]MDR7354187.1 ATP-dependent DNA helicase RecG [Corynebacterium felinum]WJY96357.1 Divergent AAA domain protein [Corynebacterium felinum]
MNSFIDPMSHRVNLEKQVKQIIESAADGCLKKIDETASIDFKEEAGRRDGKEIRPGVEQNPEAATQLAWEVACMANSPGGGVLVVGVGDKNGELIGTALNVDWLRQQIDSRIHCAPYIEEHKVLGVRILVIYVAEAPAPVPGQGGALRWRVGDQCKPVDPAEWWEAQRKRRNLDEMAQLTPATVQDVPTSAMNVLRDLGIDYEGEPVESFLLRHGACTIDGVLTGAGKLLFCPVGWSVLELTICDVVGGSVLKRITANPHKSCLEQLAEILAALEVVNVNSTIQADLVHKFIPLIPTVALREAILNGLIHRDWLQKQPTEVRWISADSRLEVRSPGGFPSGITPNNVLSKRKHRYPALADVYRSLGMVEKQGFGVDRMYQSMIVVGHRPPIIEQLPNLSVETILIGGRPNPVVMAVMQQLLPRVRQEDYRIAIFMHGLFYQAFLSTEQLAQLLQDTYEMALHTIHIACETVFHEQPIVEKLHNAWVLGRPVREYLLKNSDRNAVFPLVPYLTTDAAVLIQTALSWIEQFGSITTGTLEKLCGVSSNTARLALASAVEHGLMVCVGKGRATRFEKVKEK